LSIQSIESELSGYLRQGENIAAEYERGLELGSYPKAFPIFSVRLADPVPIGHFCVIAYSPVNVCLFVDSPQITCLHWTQPIFILGAINQKGMIGSTVLVHLANDMMQLNMRWGEQTEISKAQSKVPDSSSRIHFHSSVIGGWMLRQKNSSDAQSIAYHVGDQSFEDFDEATKYGEANGIERIRTKLDPRDYVLIEE
jgi:hypothetical protein